jgi:hypothetical protein
MDWSWLGDLFHGVMDVFRHLTKIKFSRIWKAIFDLVQRVRGWYQWYQHNVQQPMRAARQNFRQLYDKFVLPILKIVDLVRRITGIVGLFNKRLAGKLNLLFLRIEQNMLLPLQLYNKRFDDIAHIFSGFLTPLGYLDRATLLNSVWRDVRHIREILRNPMLATTPPGNLPPPQTAAQRAGLVIDYLHGRPSPISAGANASFDAFKAQLGA